MALWSLTLSLLGFLFVSLYTVFFLINKFTGVFISHFGYLSLKGIHYSGYKGIVASARRIGFRIHRPTIARPTWLSLTISKADIRVNPDTIRTRPSNPSNDIEPSNSRLQKEKIKSFVEGKIFGFSYLNLFKWIDIEIRNSVMRLDGIGAITIGSIGLTSRINRVPGAKLGSDASYSTNISHEVEKILEVAFNVSNFLLSFQNGPTYEVFNHLLFTFSGILEKQHFFRNTKVGIKFGSLDLVLDDLFEFGISVQRAFKRLQPLDQPKKNHKLDQLLEIPLLQVFEEVQVHVSHLRISKRLILAPSTTPVKFHINLKDLGFDLEHLHEPRALHQLLFSSNTIAHQALITAISCTIEMEITQQEQSTQLVSIPMITIALKSTLLSRLLLSVPMENPNHNVLIANIVVTSPAAVIPLRHIPLFLACARAGSSRGEENTNQLHFISFLPKFTLSFAVHEPAFRISMPQQKATETPDFDRILMLNCSNMLFESHGRHTTSEGFDYCLQSTIRFATKRIALLDADGRVFEIGSSENIYVKSIMESVNTRSLSMSVLIEGFIVDISKPEIQEAITRITTVIYKSTERTDHSKPRVHHRNILDVVPSFIASFKFEGRDIRVIIAAQNGGAESESRGLAIQLESWTAKYFNKPQPMNDERVMSPFSPGRDREQTLLSPSLSNYTVKPVAMMSMNERTDLQALEDEKLRTASLSLSCFEIIAIESEDTWDRENPIVAVPSIEISAAVKRDQDSGVFEVKSRIDEVKANYSLLKLFIILSTLHLLQETLWRESSNVSKNPNLVTALPSTLMPKDMVDLDLKIFSICLKAKLPQEQAILLDLHTIELTRYRWGGPALKIKAARLFVPSPSIPNTWDCLLSIRQLLFERKEAIHFTSWPGSLGTEGNFSIFADAIRFRIPHKFILYQLVDSIKNNVKCAKQLHYKISTGRDDDMIHPEPEDAQRIPRLRLKARTIALELDGDPFEARLGLIWRVGLAEQKSRMAREAAFEIKCAKLEQEATEGHIGRSESRDGSSRPSSRHSTGRRKSMRYAPDQVKEFTGSAVISVKEARKKLDRHNAQSWVKRIIASRQFVQEHVAESRQCRWSKSDFSATMDTREEFLLPLPSRPPLLHAIFSNVDLLLDRPSFPLQQLPDFLHEVGKGMPKSTQYTLLVPMNIQWTMSEAIIHLSDFPLPFVHVPKIHPSQPSRLVAWSFSSDLVIAEEYGGPDATEFTDIMIIPPNIGRRSSPAFSVKVPRTVPPVKTYATMSVDINSFDATRITWGTSLQPSIQEVMRIVESLSKPPEEASQKLGFWDKIRLVLHTQINLRWKGDGDLQLILKGSRNPYEVMGHGAGFVKCWRGNVCWKIACDPDSRKLVVVESDQFILAIPDLTHFVDFSLERLGEDDVTSRDSVSSMSATTIHKDSFLKIIMKLAGRVRWTAGLYLEQESVHGERTTGNVKDQAFKPHYEIHIKNPEYSARYPDHDAYFGFRSHYLHAHLAIECPVEEGLRNEDSSSYNAVHLSPKTFSHFSVWWQLFSSVMSIPIRSGKLFPATPESKKFGNHLMTVKFLLDLAPLWLSHMYKHKDMEDWSRGTVTATGIKAKVDRFYLDLHQRKETRKMILPELSHVRTIQHMQTNVGKIEIDTMDLRVITAEFDEANADDFHQFQRKKKHRGQKDQPNMGGSFKRSRFGVHDGDMDWIDMNDFIELDWVLPQKDPKCTVLPFALAPKFTFDRQTDHKAHARPGKLYTSRSQFGDEPSHFCLMGKHQDLREVQRDVIQTRLLEIKDQISKNIEVLNLLETRIASESDNSDLRKQSEITADESAILFDKRTFLEKLLRTATWPDKEQRIRLEHLVHGLHNASPSQDKFGFAEDVDEFSNRFGIHNIQLKWNNKLRNTVLRYAHQVNKRRGHMYYMSQKAVSFIEGLVREQQKNSEITELPDDRPRTTSTTASDDTIGQFLQDAQAFFQLECQEHSCQRRGAVVSAPNEDIMGNLAEEYEAQSNYVVKLLAPQIQLMSEKNQDVVVILSAGSMELKVVAIVDKEILDDVSGLVQQRFSVTMENAQFFIAERDDFTDPNARLHSSNNYGCSLDNDMCWPPWVPLETVLDFQSRPASFSRVVSRTNATLRYDKYNNLRLKVDRQIDESSRDSVGHPALSSKRQGDILSVKFPGVEAFVNSSQYRALTQIVMDLLIYSEPFHKEQSKRLEKIMLSTDFTDLGGAPEMVVSLQEQLRQLEEIKNQFQLSRHLDRQSCIDQVTLESEIHDCEEDLFFLMKAITTAQQKLEDRERENSPSVRWYISTEDLIWHLLGEGDAPLVDLRLSKARYGRVDNTDGSNFNIVEVDEMQGTNLLENSTYPQLLDKYEGKNGEPVTSRRKLVSAYWYMLESIGGIPIINHFELDLAPLLLQLDHKIAKILFAYAFPEKDSVVSSNIGKEKEFEDEDEDDSEAEILRMNGERYKFPGKISPNSGSGSASPARITSRSFLAPSDIGGERKVSSDAASIRSSRSTASKLFRSGSEQKTEPSQADDVTSMMSRASNNIALVKARIPRFVLCLSYKGASKRNFVDCQQFELTLPTIEYAYKMWSYMDLAQHLKKVVTKAVIGHAGTFLIEKARRKKKPEPAPRRLFKKISMQSMQSMRSGQSSYSNGSDPSVSSERLHSPIDVSPPPSVRSALKSMTNATTIRQSDERAVMFPRQVTFKGSENTLDPAQSGDEGETRESFLSRTLINLRGKPNDTDPEEGKLHRAKLDTIKFNRRTNNASSGSEKDE
ncbi:UPF0648 protein [Neolecta irregularis DAH-3]|uniref:UPF0648 protein n=1 Tax=Neolecta irregularis (strain DAH-3) TaxID=1198029 RepID=A0A1U7LRG6_NEOID|nr:UPF0648 protein [Neolecta irregularis DAH-3]|eukprot:OLL25142.1 UPF0648 protein [Neolecta irregularis DAH-3]